LKKILERLRGLSKFFDVTASSKVPVVGHNLLIKLLMLYKDFVEELPNKYSDLCLKLSEVLPGGFYDTKYMASKIQEKSKSIPDSSSSLTSDTKLFSLYQNLSSRMGNNDCVSFELNEPTYKMALEEIVSTTPLAQYRGSFCFEAGFRSMIAGIVFCKLGTFETSNGNDGFKFNLNLCEEYRRRWGNQVFIQEDLLKVLHHHVPEVGYNSRAKSFTFGER